MDRAVPAQRRSIARTRGRCVAILAALAVTGCGVPPATPSAVATAPPAAPATLPTPVAVTAAPPVTSQPARPTTTPSQRPTHIAPAWVTAGRLDLGRPQTHAVVVAGDRVVVVGSDNICTPGAAWEESVVTELGQPNAGEWTVVDELRSPRDKFVLATLSDGGALVTGGTNAETATGPDSYSSTYLFDPDTGAWSRSGLLNTARSEPAGTALGDGRVVVAGGFYLDAPEHPARMLASSELYDSVSGEWSRSGELREARYGASMVTLADGRALVVGGWKTIEDEFERSPLGTAELFDPATGRWSPAGELVLARTDFILAALPDGGALVASGRIRLDAGVFGYQVEPTATAERFDPATGAWTPTEDMGIAASERAGVVLADGRVLAAGGDLTAAEVDLDLTPPELTAASEIYDPATATWEATIALPSPRAGATGVLMPDGTAVLVGGIAAFADPGDIPGCPVPDPAVMRYVPQS